MTSLFTYWSSYVREAVAFYRSEFPAARITVGGVYASLQPKHCLEYTGCDEVCQGVHPEAEMCEPDYSLVETDFQIVHASRLRASLQVLRLRTRLSQRLSQRCPSGRNRQESPGLLRQQSPGKPAHL